MTAGTIEKMGCLEQRGYRIGVRGTSGAYFYYAHLDSYAPDLQIGDSVKAGDFLGYMGDSGYGKEGTVGKFDVHLHMGIYIDTSFGELSVNPYSILLYLDTKPPVIQNNQKFSAKR
jgi:murein DD-endopeptidase MepM/ murein hydrolase activator NlpD